MKSPRIQNISPHLIEEINVILTRRFPALMEKEVDATENLNMSIVSEKYIIGLSESTFDVENLAELDKGILATSSSFSHKNGLYLSNSIIICLSCLSALIQFGAGNDVVEESIDEMKEILQQGDV